MVTGWDVCFSFYRSFFLNKMSFIFYASLAYQLQGKRQASIANRQPLGTSSMSVARKFASRLRRRSSHSPTQSTKVFGRRSNYFTALSHMSLKCLPFGIDSVSTCECVCVCECWWLWVKSKVSCMQTAKQTRKSVICV